MQLRCCTIILAGEAAGGEHLGALQRRTDGGESSDPVAELVVYLAPGEDGGSLGGNLLAARRDDWHEPADQGDIVANNHWLARWRVDPAPLQRLPPLHGSRL